MGNSFNRAGYIELSGHKQIACVRFLPSGELVTAGDKSVRVWNPETGKAEKVWKFNNAVETCCCSPDGRYIACGVIDGLVFVFETRTRQQVAHWQAHADCGQGPLLQFFADSTYLLSAALFTCKIWSSRTTKLINTWDTSSITSVSVAADCSWLAVGASIGTATIHSLPDGCAIRRWRAHRAELWVVAFSPDRSLLATGSRDEPEGVRLWSTDSWDLVQSLRGHGGAVLDCSFSANGLQLLSCGADRTLRVWKANENGSRKNSLATGGTFTENDSSGIVGGNGSSTDLDTGDMDSGGWCFDRVLVGHADMVLSCAFSPAPRIGIVASGARDGAARVWRLADVPQGRAMLEPV